MARSRKFIPGELVRPKQGGPIMSVDCYGDFDLVHCVWLDAKHNPQSKPFLESRLEKIYSGSIRSSTVSRSNPSKPSN
jgi:uncharacterized protein YodC (DUF2158 family)